MIFDISDSEFKDIFRDEDFYLPIRWDGVNFSSTLGALLDRYENKLNKVISSKVIVNKQLAILQRNVHKICGHLANSIDHYLNGFPSTSYSFFRRAMDILVQVSLDSCLKNADDKDEDLELFRAVSVEDNKPYERERVFHTPYTLRSKVTTSRYSIAGYPSLYLGTSLELCCEEIHRNPYSNYTLASMFKLDETVEYTNTHIKIIELGIKPQDFDENYYENNNVNRERHRLLPGKALETQEVRYAYLYWYPLIAACSYIRINKKDPFASEYIIPQLLMQWARDEIRAQTKDDLDRLVGIRYFSCASVKSSDMGLNYVFPTNSKKIRSDKYCSILSKTFRATLPVFIHEFYSVAACEEYIKNSNDYDYIIK